MTLGHMMNTVVAMLDDEAQAQLIGEQMAALGPAQTAASMKFASKMMADGKGVSPAEVLQRVLAEAAANGIEGLTGPLKSMFGDLSDEVRGDCPHSHSFPLAYCLGDHDCTPQS